MHRLSRGRPAFQSGQALVEFTIAAATVLLPLFLIIPILGKYMDMKAASIQAARYAAWERTVWFGGADWTAATKSDLEIQREIQQRFFSDTAAAKLQSSQSAATGWGGTGPKPIWRDRGGNPMLANYDGDVTQATPRGQTPGTMDAILTPVVEVVNVVDSILGAKFELDMQSLYTTTVNVQTVQTMPIKQILKNTSSSAGTPLFRMTNVLVANGWSANGAGNVKKQVEGLTPSSVAQRDPLKTVLTVVQYVSTVFAPELMPDHLKFGGDIQPDIVPTDRIK
ncbi:MAG: hypothetical protein JWN94_1296 [Betaproteobacteria bacterium]|nr:hypothetical protein [Betaproteobacteria bacterium]